VLRVALCNESVEGNRRLKAVLHSIHLRARLYGSLFAAIIAFALLPRSMRVSTRMLVGWDIGVTLYIGVAIWSVARASIEAMKERAAREYDGATAILVLTVGAAVASLAAIGAELHGIRSAASESEPLRLALAGFTILCSWFFLHVIFAIHYAHEFYAREGHRASLAFPNDRSPDYLDFLYFSFTVGAAAQTSDVSVTSQRVRRIVLAHTVLSFLFNTTVLALAVNVAAGLL
jgi:uncharacterized membrane protein